ncbi:hypothetical protein [Harryflintia acetispora]|uniref:hypothetical protein n=1 Tax=Harryflintia acetispora TaxID=1849041 RepID=UPI0014049D7A|nr:hypothetical protein [Harryflintia acetispora]
MWSRISHWTCGLTATTADCIASYIPDLPVDSFGNIYLRQAAAVNIRKSGGGKNSSMDVIRSYAAFDAKRLLEQLQLYNPTVIVCCYTGSALDIIWKEANGSVVRTPHNENLYYTIRLNHRRRCLSADHPGRGQRDDGYPVGYHPGCTGAGRV